MSLQVVNNQGVGSDVWIINIYLDIAMKHMVFQGKKTFNYIFRMGESENVFPFPIF